MTCLRILLFLFLGFGAWSQSNCAQNPYWQTGGNTVGPAGAQLGTCNRAALHLKTGDSTRLLIGAEGHIFAGRQKIRAGHPHANSPFQFDGKLACKELVVVDPHKWADFVFDPDYPLMPLEQLENYYREKRRLPGIPGEEEVLRNGLDVAEMDALLLQKIEELSLHLVALNKRLLLLEAENARLKEAAR